MVGTLHQGILALFRADPWLAFDLLGLPRPSDGTPVDRRGEVEYDHTQVELKLRQGFPDLVLVDEGPIDEDEAGVVITVEAQNRPDHAKRFMIPVYQALLALEHGCSCYVVVASFSTRVSELLREWGDGPPPKLDVMLLDAKTVPRTPWLDDDCQRPMAVILVAALHARRGDLSAARRGLRAVMTLAREQRWRHAMTIMAAVPERLREQLLGELPVEQRDMLLEIERESGTFAWGRREGLAEGLKEGLKEGLAEGRMEGREEGRRMALVELTLALLEDRGIEVDSESEARIRACRELSVLQDWARRAARVTCISELLAQ